MVSFTDAETIFHMTGLLKQKKYQQRRCDLFLDALRPRAAASYLKRHLPKLPNYPERNWTDLEVWINTWVIPQHRYLDVKSRCRAVGYFAGFR